MHKSKCLQLSSFHKIKTLNCVNANILSVTYTQRIFFLINPCQGRKTSKGRFYFFCFKEWSKVNTQQSQYCKQMLNSFPQTTFFIISWLHFSKLFSAHFPHNQLIIKLSFLSNCNLLNLNFSYKYAWIIRAKKRAGYQ